MSDKVYSEPWLLLPGSLMVAEIQTPLNPKTCWNSDDLEVHSP